MKKIIIFSVLSFFLLGSTGLVYGQNGTTTLPKPPLKKELRAEVKELKGELKTKKEELREETKKVIEKLKEKRKEFKTEIKKKIEEATKNRVERNLKEMTNNLTRIGEINTKLETQITKLETAGKDVSLAKTALTTAKEKWTAGKTAIDSASAYLATIVASTNKEGDVNQIKEYLKTAEESLKIAKESTNKTISSLKGLATPAKIRAESEKPEQPTGTNN